MALATFSGSCGSKGGGALLVLTAQNLEEGEGGFGFDGWRLGGTASLVQLATAGRR